MKYAIELAKKGNGKVFPNPSVGCVIVKNGKIVGRGWHKIFGGNHAEINAILDAGKNTKGADLYVTLEPCNSFGKKPPCSDAIVKAGIKKVFYAVKDKAVNGTKKLLEENGVEIQGGVLEKSAKFLIKDYLKHLNVKPKVTIKAAMSLDGKIATSNYDSKWITSEKSRKFVHNLRSGYDAVLVGTNTALKDNPFLTSHSKKLKNPVRVVIDLILKIPRTYNLLDASVPTIIVYGEKIKKIPNYLIKDGIILAAVDAKKAKKNFNVIVEKLRQFSIKTILIEGGSETIASALFSKCVDDVCFFIAPKIIGGKDAVSVVGGSGAKKVSDSLQIKSMRFKKIDKDLLLTGILKREKNVHRNY